MLEDVPEPQNICFALAHLSTPSPDCCVVAEQEDNKQAPCQSLRRRLGQRGSPCPLNTCNEQSCARASATSLRNCNSYRRPLVSVVGLARQARQGTVAAGAAIDRFVVPVARAVAVGDP